VRAIERAVTDAAESTTELVQGHAQAAPLTMVASPASVEVTAALDAIDQPRARGSIGVACRSAKLKTVISTGLEQTASLWNPIAAAYDWEHPSGNHPDNDRTRCTDRTAQPESIPECNGTQKAQVGELGIDHF